MKLKDGFVLRQVGGAYVVVAVGLQTLDFKGMIRLNETGAFLWQQLQQEQEASALVEAVLAGVAGITGAGGRYERCVLM